MISFLQIQKIFYTFFSVLYLFFVCFSAFADVIYNSFIYPESFPFCLFIQGMPKSRSYFDAELLG